METSLRQIVNPVGETEADTSAWKLIVLVFLGLGSSALAGYYLSIFFTASRLAPLLASFSFAALFAIFTVFNVFFLKDKWLLRGTLFIECFIPLLFFFSVAASGFATLLFAAFALFLIFTVNGAVRGKRILENGLAIHFFEIARPVMTKLVTGFLIFLSILAYVEYIGLGKLNAETGQFTMNQILVSADPVLKLQFAGVSFNQTISEFARAVAKSTINKTRFQPINDPNLGLQGDLTQLPQETQDRIIDALSTNLIQSLEGRFGTLNLQERAGDAIFRIVKNALGNFSGGAKSLLGATGAVLFFLALRGIALILLPIIEFIGYLLFKLLLIAGFARITIEMRNREFVVLS
ncbi:MAG: hypothetical protein Q7R98_00465 [Candidatus Jorgensenbacteria bacterium]|nr:hypothetical protein [Candidatus Jorgensenbacteria bacterium]